MIWPWRASEGAVRKKRPLSSAVESAGEVAEGEIITMPFGTAAFARIAPVTPEQSAPMMPLIPSEVIRRSAAAVAAALSTQVESAWTADTVEPSNSLPLSLTSWIASSAPAAIDGVRLSIGPVKPRMIPSLMSSADAAPARSAVAVVARSSFFMACLPVWIWVRAEPKSAYCKRKAD
jgi:hypothetical protein